MSALRRTAVAALGPVLLFGAGAFASVEAQTLSGTLLSMDGDRPISSGVVELLRAGDAEPVASAVSDRTGRFQVTAPEPGIFIVRGLAPFHHPFVDGPVELEAAATVVVQFRLTPNPVQLDPVEVEAEARNPRLERAGFYDRERQGMGHFFSEEDIDRRNPMYLSDLLRPLPRVVVDDSTFPPSVALRGRPSFRSSGTCRPRVYVDGFPEYLADSPVNMIPPHNVAAIEVYPSQVAVPAQFGGGLTGCGVIAIWTRG
jgi:hypothetical protein